MIASYGTPYSSHIFSIIGCLGKVFPFSHAQSVLLLICNKSAATFCEYPAFSLAARKVILIINITTLRLAFG